MAGGLAFGPAAGGAALPAGGWLGAARPGRRPLAPPSAGARRGRFSLFPGRRDGPQQLRAAALPAGGRAAREPRGATPARGPTLSAFRAAADGSPPPTPWLPVAGGIMAEARHLLRSRFGHRSFAPGQERILRNVLTGGIAADGGAGGSALAVLPTGGGKSLCYQLSALLLAPRGATLVVEPTRALMDDATRRLAAVGIPAMQVRASTSDGEWAAAMAAVVDGAQPLVLLTTPEGLRGLARDRLQWLPVALMVVDEVHCMAEWSSFRPDYLRLPHVAAAVGPARVLALTATATAGDAAEIVRRFGIPPGAVVRTPYERPNLWTTTVSVPPAEVLAAAGLPIASAAKAAFKWRVKLLRDLLRKHPRGPTLVYVNTRSLADRLTTALAIDGLPVAAYHGGLPSARKSDVLTEFLDTHDGIVVCTSAFGMGVDKSNVRVREWKGGLSEAVGVRGGGGALGSVTVQTEVDVRFGM